MNGRFFGACFFIFFGTKRSCRSKDDYSIYFATAPDFFVAGQSAAPPRSPRASRAAPRSPTGMKKGPLKREPRKGGCRRLLLRHYYEKVYLKSISWLLCF